MAQTQTATPTTFTVLYSFEGATGEFPLAVLIVDSSGNLYGTTSEGGAHGGGTVFKVTESGEETVLHSLRVESQKASLETQPMDNILLLV